jgi:hypothetical protein
MGYDPVGFYPMGYDHRGMSMPMHGGAYDMPMDMYLPQSTSSMSSRSRNSTDVRFNFLIKNHFNTLSLFPFSMNKRSMHFFVIHQHPVGILLMIIVANLIEIIDNIEIITIIIINPPPDIVQNHVNVVVKLIIFRFFSFNSNNFVFLSFVFVRVLAFSTRLFLSYCVQMGKTHVFIRFFSLLRCMNNQEKNSLCHFFFCSFLCIHLAHSVGSVISSKERKTNCCFFCLFYYLYETNIRVKINQCFSRFIYFVDLIVCGTVKCAELI